MHITTDGIVLRERAIEDEDSILTLLTKDRGVISAYARGARKLRGNLRVSSELLSYSCFVLFSNKEKYSVDKADLNNVFMKVRGDILKLSLASYLCQLTGEVAPREENAQEYLRLLLNSLYFLDSDKRTCEFIKPLYELRIMTMAGYMPNLVACCECASFEKAEMYFLPLTSQLICGDCVKNLPENQIKYLLNPGVLAAMRHIIYAGDEKLFNFTLSSPLLKQLNQISQEYIKCHLEKKFDTLDFYLTMSD